MLSLWTILRLDFDAAARMFLAQLRGVGHEGDDDGAEPVDQAPVLQQLGLMARPVVARTLRALGVQHGDEVFVLKLWDRTRTPTDLEVGETRAYAAGAVGNVLRLLVSRAVLEAPEIRLGASASKGVNRAGDPIVPGALAVSAATVPGTPAVSTVTITYTPPTGAPQVVAFTITGAVAVAGGGSITLGGQTGAGSAKVRAED